MDQLNDFCSELSRTKYHFKMKTRITLTLFALIISSSIMFSQAAFRGLIKGRVTDSATGDPFSNVTVALYSLPDSTLRGGVATDDAGEFMLQAVSEGSYYIVLSFIGYQSQVFPFVLAADAPETDLGEFFLREVTGDAGDVTVTAVRPQVIYQQDKKVVRVDEFRQAGATTLAQVLENVPSVTTDIEGNVLLRGSSNYTLLIDGNPAPQTGANLLRQIPAEMVETIEVMTNPSAKYDPDGTAGIINLILKKQQQAGFNGMVTLMAGLGGKYTGDARLNYRKGKVNIFAGLTGMRYGTDVSVDLLRETELPGGQLLMDSYLDQNVLMKTGSFNGGADITFNERNTLTVSGTFGPINQSVEIATKVFRDYRETSTLEYALNTNDLVLKGFMFNPSLNFTHKFRREGEKIRFNLFGGGAMVDISQYLSESETDNQWVPGSVLPVLRESVLTLDLLDIRIKADYERPVGEKSKLEAGLQYNTMSDSDNNNFRNYDHGAGTWVPDNIYSNEFSFGRDILSGYTTWSSGLGKFNYQLGLRGEYEYRIIDQITLNEEYSYDKFSLFPTVHVTRPMKNNQQLQLSYSRRINRPNWNVLNPFPQFIDDQTIARGNPQVRPEYTGSWELNYQRQVKIGSLSAESFYRQSNDLISNIVVTDDEGTLFLTSANANRSHSAGLEFMANLQPVNWLRMMVSGSGYYYLLDDETISTGVDESTFTWNMNSNLIFLFSPTTRFSLQGMYTGPSINIQGRTRGAFMLNAGLSQSLMKQKLNLSLGFRDILGSYKIRSTSEGMNFKVTTIAVPEQRVLTLTATYNFNNYQRRADQQESLDMNFIR
jgi:outer membrane receptor protein involved in Fe transport